MLIKLLQKNENDQEIFVENMGDCIIVLKQNIKDKNIQMVEHFLQEI